MGKHRCAPNRLHRARRPIGADEEALTIQTVARDQYRTRRHRNDLLDDAGVEQRLELSPPARRLAKDHEIVGAELILIEDAVGDIGCGLELEDHRPSFWTVVLDLGVAGGVVPGFLMARLLRPAFGI